MCPLSNPNARFVGYLNDPVAVGGPESLFLQKRAVERAAALLGAGVDVWCVDSGRRFAGQRCGDALLRLISVVRRGDTVVVENWSVLGADEEAVAVVAGTLAMLGAAVLATRGLLAGVNVTGAPVQASPSRRRPRVAEFSLEACR